MIDIICGHEFKILTSTIESPENILVEIASVLPLLHHAFNRFFMTKHFEIHFAY